MPLQALPAARREFRSPVYILTPVFRSEFHSANREENRLSELRHPRDGVSLQHSILTRFLKLRGGPIKEYIFQALTRTHGRFYLAREQKMRSSVGEGKSSGKILPTRETRLPTSALSREFSCAIYPSRLSSRRV